MATEEDEKAEAARRSLEFVHDGMVVGLGTGSTAKYVIEQLGARVRQGMKIRGVPTSRATAELAQSLGIPLVSFDEVEWAHVTIDGADEIGPGLSLIKGGGGALLHEKIVASASRQLVIVADEHKLVEHLGRFPLPVEVIPFAAGPVQRKLESLGGRPTLRRNADGSAYITDEGNVIFQCAFGRIDDTAALDRELNCITGVVEHGLFLGLASVAVVASADGVRLLTDL